MPDLRSGFSDRSALGDSATTIGKENSHDSCIKHRRAWHAPIPDQLGCTGNNLANINTVAYKGARVEFQDTLSQTLRAPTPDTATTSGAAGMQVGNGMAVSAIKNTFTQGAMKNTGVRTDMSVNGKGFSS